MTNNLFTYKNKGNNSGIIARRCGNNFIIVAFKNAKAKDGMVRYKYTKKSVGFDVLKEMHRLSKEGVGLNSFIGKNRPPFTEKE